MFAGEYMQFSLICSLPKSLVLIHVMLTTMYNPMYNTLMYTMPKIGIHFLKKNESTRAVVICHG
jgi:hypothetical protein